MTLGHGLYGLPEPELPKKPPSKWRWAIRIPLIFLCVMTASLFTLSVMGGNSPELRENLEDYLSQATGMQASIGTLVYAGFYPAMGMAAEDIRFVRKGGDAAGEELIRLGEARFAMAFWSIPSGTPKFRMLAVKDARIAAGVFTPRAITVEKIMIDPKAMAFVAEGAYGGEDFSATVPLKSKMGLAKVPVYMMADEAPFTMKAGNIFAKGVFRPLGGKRLGVRIEELRTGAAYPVSADLVIGRNIKGTIKNGESAAMVDLRLTQKGRLRHAGGEVVFSILNRDDLYGSAGVSQIWRELQMFYYGPDLVREKQGEPYDFSRASIDTDFKVADFRAGKAALGSMAGRFIVKDNIAALDSLSGDMHGGALSGSVRLDATGNPGKLDAGLAVRGIDYARLYGGTAEGRADVVIALKAEGNNSAALIESLNGKAVVAAGPGGLSAKGLGAGGRVVQAMLPAIKPDADLHLACGLWMLEIRRQEAAVRALLIEADDKVLTGEGAIDLERGTASLRFAPVQETPSLSGLGVAQGDLAENHPCRKFVNP